MLHRLPPVHTRPLLLTAALALCLGGTGCSSFMGQYRTPEAALDTKPLEVDGYAFDEHGVVQPKAGTLSSSGLPTVVLDVRNGEKHMERIPISPDKPLFIADVIDDAKLVKRIGKIRVTIIRATAPNVPPVRMDVTFDSSGRNVMAQQNYALQPNDRIIVSPDDRNFLTNMLGSLARKK